MRVLDKVPLLSGRLHLPRKAYSQYGHLGRELKQWRIFLLSFAPPVVRLSEVEVKIFSLLKIVLLTLSSNEGRRTTARRPDRNQRKLFDSRPFGIIWWVKTYIRISLYFVRRYTSHQAHLEENKRLLCPHQLSSYEVPREGLSSNEKRAS